MYKFMIATSLVLFWGFYEMSGGADFEPPEREIAVADTPVAPKAPPVAAIEPAPIAEIVEAAFEVPETETAAIAESDVIAEDTQEVALSDAQEPVVAQTSETSFVDLRFVDGDRVNLRDGPSTAYRVLDTLSRGTEAEVIEVTLDGWVQIRLSDSGKTGWMAERLLTDG